MTKTRLGIVAYERLNFNNKKTESPEGRISVGECFTPPRGPSEAVAGAVFHAPCSPSLALGTVLSPATPRAAVWGGRGTAARPRVVAWRSGVPFQKGAFENRLRSEGPKRDDDVHVYYIIRTYSITEYIEYMSLLRSSTN